MWKIFSILALTSFTLHLIWENVQAPLYLGYQSLTQCFALCFYATLGDVLITLIVYSLVALLKRDAFWLRELRGADVAVLAIVGAFIALWIEQQALLLGKWDYNEMMPLVPYFGAGLTPLLQMMILLPLSMYITNLCMRRFSTLSV